MQEGAGYSCSIQKRKVITMNIEISTKEYRDLLDILHIADVIMSGHRREEDKRIGQHRALIQKLYALAQGAGLDLLVDYKESVKKYVPTGDFEHSSLAHVMIDEFGDHLFWDQLISRLTERDAAQIAGVPDSPDAAIDRKLVEGPIRQQYIQEFTKNGVANLAVVERFSAGDGTPAMTSD
jgi:hypothetical protein